LTNAVVIRDLEALWLKLEGLFQELDFPERTPVMVQTPDKRMWTVKSVEVKDDEVPEKASKTVWIQIEEF